MMAALVNLGCVVGNDIWLHMQVACFGTSLRDLIWLHGHVDIAYLVRMPTLVQSKPTPHRT